jgi:hypothetical protein
MLQSAVTKWCPSCNLTLPTDYDDPQCPSCNAQLIKMNEKGHQAAKGDQDKSAKGNVKMLRFFALLNLAGGIIGGIATLSSSVPLGIAFIIEGGLGFAFLNVIGDIADDLREIRKSSNK